MSDETTNETPKDLREALERAQSEAEAERARAEAVAQEFRQYKTETSFKEAGFTASQANLFLRANPDAEVTTEAIKAFADELGIAPQANQESAPPSEAQPDPGASLAGLGGAAGSQTGGANPAAQPQMSKEDFEKLLQTDPDAAAAAYMAGTAPRNPLNVEARRLVDKGIIDH